MRDSRRDEVSRFDDSSRIQPKGSVSGDCYLIYQDKCSRHVLWSSDEEDSVYLVHVLVLSAMHYRHITFSLVWMCMIHLFEYFFMTGKEGGGGRRVKETSKLICTLCSGYQSHTSTGIYKGFCTNQFCRRQSKGWWILPPTSMHPHPPPPPPTFLLFYLKNKN